MHQISPFRLFKRFGLFWCQDLLTSWVGRKGKRSSCAFWWCAHNSSVVGAISSEKSVLPSYQCVHSSSSAVVCIPFWVTEDLKRSLGKSISKTLFAWVDWAFPFPQKFSWKWPTCLEGRGKQCLIEQFFCGKACALPKKRIQAQHTNFFMISCGNSRPDLGHPRAGCIQNQPHGFPRTLSALAR